MTTVDFHLCDDHVDLIPITPEHYEYLYWLSVSDFNSLRWRYRGQLPPYEVFVQQIHGDVLIHFMVRCRQRESLIGYCVAYGADLRNKHSYVGALMDPSAVGSGLGSNALQLLTTYLFKTWDFHKVFAEVPAFTLESMFPKLDRLSETSSLFEVEGVLKDFFYYDGRMWDMYIVGATAESVRQNTEPSTAAAPTKFEQVVADSV